MGGDITFDEFLRLMLPVFTGKVEDEDLYYAFKKFDLDNSGYISIKELQQILARIGQNYSLDQISELVSIVDGGHGDGQLSYDEFVKLMKLPASVFENLGRKKVTVVKEMSEEERRRNEAVNVLRQVFQQIDVDGSGQINAREMDTILKRLNIKLSRNQVEKMMRDANLDCKKISLTLN